jgi:ABC-type transport system substrate-binding protein
MKELPLSLDYGYDWSEAGVWVQSNIGDCLIWRDRATAAYVPWLASDYTKIDDLVWRITIRPGIAFTNGEVFDAAAAKYWFDRIRADPQMLPHRQWNFVDRVDVVDDLTIDVVTVAPEPAFANKMAGTGCQVVPPATPPRSARRASASRRSAPARTASSSGCATSAWCSRPTRTTSAARRRSTGSSSAPTPTTRPGRPPSSPVRST